MSKDRGEPAGRFRAQMRLLGEDELVLAARRVLLRRGCSGLRVEEVAAARGVAEGTCHQHFGARPDLINAAVRRLDEALAKRLLSPPARLTKPRQVFEWACFYQRHLPVMAEHILKTAPPGADVKSWRY